MNIDSLNSRKLKAAFYLIPLGAMLAASLPYLITVIGAVSAAEDAAVIIFHLLFLLSLAAACGNAMTEIFLSILQEGSKSSINSILYGGRPFFPLRACLYDTVFIAAYIFLTQIIVYRTPIETLMLLVPSVAIFINAPHFFSGRIRYIGGTYFIYKDRFRALFSYYVDDKGILCVIMSDGQAVDTGVAAAEIDFEKLEADFAQNKLKSNPQP